MLAERFLSSFAAVSLLSPLLTGAPALKIRQTLHHAPMDLSAESFTSIWLFFYLSFSLDAQSHRISMPHNKRWPSLFDHQWFGWRERGMPATCPFECHPWSPNQRSLLEIEVIGIARRKMDTHCHFACRIRWSRSRLKSNVFYITKTLTRVRHR